MNRDCDHWRPLISEYYDGRLEQSPGGAESAEAVAEHLGQCPDCREELEQLSSLSQLVAESPSPPPPAELAWNTFARRLVCEPTQARHSPAIVSAWRFRLPVLPAAIAAGFLFLVAWVGWMSQPGSQGASIVADLEPFVNQFVRDPDAAQIQLIARYQGEPIQTTEVANRWGLPISAETLTDAPFRLVSLHKLSMPCCDCVEAVCTRADGTKIAVFGHKDHAPVKVGDGREQRVHCDGKVCRLIELPQSQYAVQWQAGPMRLLVVGARDQSEIEQLVAWLSPDLRPSAP